MSETEVILTREQRRQLSVVDEYEQRYHGACWSGRGGTTDEVLDWLVDQGLLVRTIDDRRLRFWYRLTPEGVEALS